MTLFANSRLGALVFAAGTLLLTACGGNITSTDDPAKPLPLVAGWLTVKLVTPNTDDGAVQFQFSGPAIDSLQAVGSQGFTSTDENGAQMIATGQVQAGVVGKFFVKDISRVGEYHVAIVAAAARGTYALQDLQGYSANVVH